MHSDSDRKANLKALRQERQASIKRATAAMKAQRKSVKAIADRLSNGSATVPEIAEHTGIPSDAVLWFIATMKKYGQVVEDGKDGGYYHYAATPATGNEEKTGDHP